MFIDQRIRFHLIQQQLPPPPARILEVGCGYGELLKHLSGLGYQMRGCEVLPELVEQAVKTGLSEIVYQTSGTSLPEPDDSYDAVISSDVLEHVPPDLRENFMKEMVRVTRPTGRVIMSYWSRNNLPFRIYGGYWLWRRGYLPQWYMEHITLTPPVMSDVAEFMTGLGRLIIARKYQGPVNMLLCCIDHLDSARFPRVHRFLGRQFLRVLALDRFGGCSSQLIVLEKITSGSSHHE